MLRQYGLLDNSAAHEQAPLLRCDLVRRELVLLGRHHLPGHEVEGGRECQDAHVPEWLHVGQISPPQVRMEGHTKLSHAQHPRRLQ